jgi:hypothetical protein
MNNEPVAWIGKNELQFGFTDTIVTNEKESWDDIPLYTHPAKPLSNVVVASATCSCGKVMEFTNLQEAKTLTDEEIWEVINRTAWVGTEEEIRFKIAEAILRKAQEK